MKSRQMLLVFAGLLVLLTACTHSMLPEGGSMPAAAAGFHDPASSGPTRLVVQLSHSNHISAMAVSSDGRMLITAGWDRTVRMWNAHTGQEIRRFSGHGEVVRATVLSPDGGQLLTGSVDNSARLWDTRSGEQLLHLQGHTGAVTAAAWPAGRNWLVTGSEDMTVRLWDRSNGHELRRLTGFDGEITALAVSADSRHLLIGSGTRAELWDPASGHLLRRFEGHQGGVSDVAISPDGQFVLTGSVDRTARLWDLSTGSEVQRYTGHTQALTSVAFTHDARLVVTAANDASVRLWDRRQGTSYGSPLQHEGAVTAVATSPVGPVLFTGAGQSAYAWERAPLPRGARRILSFEGYSDWVSAVAFSPDGKRLLIGTWDDTARLWDTDSGTQLPPLRGHAGDVRGVAFSPDGHLIATAARDGTARIWDSDGGAELHRLTGHDASGAKGVRPVVFSADGHFLLSGGDDGTARLWDAQADFAERLSFGPHTDRVSAVAFSPDGRQALTASASEIWLWNTGNGHQIRRFSGHKRLVNAAAFSPDGRRVLSAAWDNSARLWDVSTGDELLRLEGHSEGVHSAVFSPDGRYIVTGSEDKTVRLWDAASGAQLRQFSGHSGAVIQVTVSDDGRFLLSASADQTARLWDIASGEELCKLISFQDGSWAVVDSAGRFDASNAGDVAGLHWVVGLETIGLKQLKQRYYDPGLLAKKLGHKREPLRRVEAFRQAELFPAVIVQPMDPHDPRLELTLVNRGGGLGRVTVLINGKEVLADARDAGVDPGAGRADLAPLPLAGHPYLLPGRKNTIEVRAYNAEGYLSSRGVTIDFEAPGDALAERPTLWAIVAGVSDYAGEQIDLRYAAKDAEDMARSLKVAAARLFGADRLRLQLLTTSSDAAPTRENIEEAFVAARQAKSTDLLLVYLAGHGVNHGGQDGDFYYLTSAAAGDDLGDPAVRAGAAISSAELTEWIKKIPALKQVLILDTCASGRVVDKLSSKRDIASSQIRSLDRMKDRTGLYVLAGAAADAVSYEASRYGQGLLTYSLLFGMRGAALREEQFVDVSQWFNHAADQVPELATGIGGIQRPVIAMPTGGASFDIGQVLADDRQRIPLATVRPLLFQSSFQDEGRVQDHLRLTMRVNEALREVSSVRGPGARFVYVHAAVFPDAYELAGRYRIDGRTVKVNVRLFRNGVQKTAFDVTGDTAKLDRLVADILTRVERALAAAPV
jgi:WD40 repeat protein